MSEKVLIQQHTDAGLNFGKLPSAEEFMNIQRFAHKHIEGIVRDAIMKGSATAVVVGFDYTLPGSLEVSVGAGQAISVAGLSHETLPAGDPSLVELAAAHATLPRIDLIYARLDTDVQTDTEFRPFRRLRTPAELELGVNPYPPSGYNLPTKEDTQAVVLVRQGTPNAVPVAPAAGAGEVALYQVRVNATATVLTPDKVTDVRPLFRSLYQANALIDTIGTALASLPETVQDLVGAMIQSGWAIVVSYDDVGGIESIAVNQVALDARYVNTNGDSMTGLLRVMPDGEQETYTKAKAGEFQRSSVADNVTAVVGHANMSFTGGSVIGMEGKSIVDGNNVAAYGGKFIAKTKDVNSINVAAFFGVYGEAVLTGTPSNYNFYGVYGKAPALPNCYGGYFNGNVAIYGNCYIELSDPNAKGLTVKLAPSAVANGWELQNSAGTVLERVASDGRRYNKVPNTAPTDSLILTNQATFYLDEVNNLLKVRVRYSDGTYKTGQIALA
jgi:hypothetical protein